MEGAAGVTMSALNEEEEFEFRYRLEQEQAQPQKQPGFLEKVGSAIEPGLSIYQNSQLGAPQDLLNRFDQTVRHGANKAGEFVAEEAGRSGVNPYVAAGMGTAMSMTPDLVEAAVMPSSAIEGAERAFRPLTRPLARRSLGLTKRFLNTPLARNQANRAADIALDQGVIPSLGDPTVAMERAKSLQNRSGEALGTMRDAAGVNPLDQVFDSIETARTKATGGLRGGAWDTVHRKFDEAQETLLSLIGGGAETSLGQVEKVKKLLSKTVNWMADNVSQETAKQVSGAIENGVETIMRSKGLDMVAYEAEKGTYGASKLMQKGLSNEIAAQEGNNAVSLPTMVMGAGQLATGSPQAAAATLGVVEALRRRGTGIAAKAADAIPRQLTSVREPIRATVPVQSFLQSVDPSRNLTNSENPPKKSFKSLFGIRVKNPGQPGERPAYGGQNQVAEPNNNRNQQGNEDKNNGNFKGQQNHGPSKRLLKPKQEKILTSDVVKKYLKQARNNPAMARQMAKADGWTIPE